MQHIFKSPLALSAGLHSFRVNLKLSWSMDRALTRDTSLGHISSVFKPSHISPPTLKNTLIVQLYTLIYKSISWNILELRAHVLDVWCSRLIGVWAFSLILLCVHFDTATFYDRFQKLVHILSYSLTNNIDQVIFSRNDYYVTMG